jgi:hypothetical protein
MCPFKNASSFRSTAHSCVCSLHHALPDLPLSVGFVRTRLKLFSCAIKAPKAASLKTNEKLDGLAVARLPHLDRLNGHAAVVALAPGWEPVVLRCSKILATVVLKEVEKHTLPEIPGSEVASVNPWLAAFAIKEPAVLRANGDVENQVELLVKGRILATPLPRVVVERAVLGCQAIEAALLPQRLIELGVLNLLESAVQVHEHVVLCPLKSESVEASSEVAAAHESLAVSLDVTVMVGRGTPMECRRHEVAAFGVFVVVTASLSDVDFT